MFLSNLFFAGAELASPALSMAVTSLSNVVKCALYHLASFMSSSADVLSGRCI